jgi:hypothetical protein
VIDPSSCYDVVARVELEDLRAKNAEAQRLAGEANDRAHRQIQATLDYHAREMHHE